MRLARPLLAALLLLLALAPAASAHDETESDHRDTPADLAARGHRPHARSRAPERARSRPTCPQYLPTTWCGAANRDTDDTAHAAFPASLRQIKVVYAHAHDQPDDFDAVEDALQTNVSRIEQFLALQTGGRRALRFDMGTECGPQYVDIQVVPPALRPHRLRLRQRRPELLRRGRRRGRRRRPAAARATCSSSPTGSPTIRIPPTTTRQRRVGHRRGLADDTAGAATTPTRAA